MSSKERSPGPYSKTLARDDGRQPSVVACVPVRKQPSLRHAYGDWTASSRLVQIWFQQLTSALSELGVGLMGFSHSYPDP